MPAGNSIRHANVEISRPESNKRSLAADVVPADCPVDLNRCSRWPARVAWSSNSIAFATTYGDASAVWIWDAVTGARRATLEDPSSDAAVGTVAWSPDGGMIASASEDGVRLWDARAGLLHATLHGLDPIAWSPDGGTIAGGGSGRTALLWDGHTGRIRVTLRSEVTGPFIAVAWSPDSRSLASTGEDCAVRIWDPQTGTLHTTLRRETGHTRHWGAVAWSADASTIVASCGDGKIGVWDVHTGALRSIFEHRSQWPWMPSFALQPGARFLAVVAGDLQIVRLADLRSVWLQAYPNGTRDAMFARTNDGIFDGDAAVLHRIVYRVGPDLRSATLVTADQLAATCSHPHLVADFLSGRVLEAGAACGRPGPTSE